MPGRTRGQLVLLEQDGICASQLGEMVETAGPDHATADHDDTRMVHPIAPFAAGSIRRSLADEVEYPIDYHVVGSLRLAHTRERMSEFHHVRSMARLNGMEYEILGPDEIADRYPFLTLDGIRGALWDPYDGDIDPAQLTQAFAKGGRSRGARIRRCAKVIGLAMLPHGTGV